MIARHLSHERRGGDGGALPVPLHDVHLPRIKMQRVAVQKHDVHRDALSLHRGDGGGEGLAQSRRHAHTIDIGRLHVLHRPRPGAPAHFACDGLAILRPHLLGVVEPGDGVVRVQHDAPYGQRPRQGPPSHLVQPDDHRPSPLGGELLLEGVHPREPRLLGGLGLKSAPRHLHGGPYALARVGHKRPLQHGEGGRVGLLQLPSDLGDGQINHLGLLPTGEEYEKGPPKEPSQTQKIRPSGTPSP